MPQVSWKTLLIGELSWQRLGRSMLFIYTFFALYVFFRADHMIFLPQPATYQDNPKSLKLAVTPTEKISALYLPYAPGQDVSGQDVPGAKASGLKLKTADPGSGYTLLYIHGNAEDLGTIRPILQRLGGWGFGVFAYDYRGYGTSDGQPSEAHAYEDAEAAYAYLTERLKISPEKIIVYGRSVGGGSATELATRHRIGGLVLESTFTSAFRVVVPFPLLPFDKFSNLDKLKKVRCPVLVLHGEADRTIPIQHGKTLYAAASEPKRFLWVPEAGHDDLTWVAGPDHQAALLSFQKLVAAQARSPGQSPEPPSGQSPGLTPGPAPSPSKR